MKLNKRKMIEETRNFKTWDEYRNYGIYLARYVYKDFNDMIKMCTFLVKIPKKRDIQLPKFK